MSGTRQAVCPLQDGVSSVLLPRSHRTACSGIPHPVVLAFKVVGRVDEVISYRLSSRPRPFGHSGRLVLRKFPRLLYPDTLRQRLLPDGGQIVVHPGHPDNVSSGEAHEVEIRCAVIVNEKRSVDALFVPNRLLHLLTERTLGSVCRRHADMLLDRVEEVELLLRLDVIHFGSPKAPRRRKSRQPPAPGLRASSLSSHRTRSKQNPLLPPCPPVRRHNTCPRKTSHRGLLSASKRFLLLQVSLSPRIQPDRSKVTRDIYNFSCSCCISMFQKF